MNKFEWTCQLKVLANSFGSAQEAIFFDITIIRIKVCLREDIHKILCAAFVIQYANLSWDICSHVNIVYDN